MHGETAYKKIGSRESLLCATIGLFTALSIILLMGVFVLISEIPIGIATGILSLYSCAYFYGGLAGRIVYKTGVSDYKVWLNGVLLAWACIISSAFIGSLFYFFKETVNYEFANTFFDYVAKPVVWVFLVGSFPGLLLGGYWASRVKKKLLIHRLL